MSSRIEMISVFQNDMDGSHIGNIFYDLIMRSSLYFCFCWTSSVLAISCRIWPVFILLNGVEIAQAVTLYYWNVMEYRTRGLSLR